MKASDSATSLTGLTASDTGCQFCAEGEDMETGKGLVDSKAFLSCGCRFVTHVSCWTKYLEDSPSRPICPRCQKPISPWRKALTEVEVAAAEAKLLKEHRSSLRILGFAGLVVAILIVFLLVMLLPRAR